MIKSIEGGSALEKVDQPKKMSKVHEDILKLYPEIESSNFAFHRTVVENTITNAQLVERIRHFRGKEGPKNTRDLEIAETLLRLRTNGQVLPSLLETQAVSGPAVLL